jgi:hypothetical protein
VVLLFLIYLLVFVVDVTLEENKMRIYKNKEALLRAIKKKKEIVDRLHIDNINKFKNLGWGYGMRAYSRLKHDSHHVEDKHRKDLEELENQLKNFESNHHTLIIKKINIIEQQLELL